MHRFKLSRDLQSPCYQGAGVPYQTLRKNTEYVTESIYLGELLDLDPFLEASAWINTKAQLPKENKKARLLFIRSYGIGDILFLTPLARQLKKNWPLLEISLACQDEYAPIFKNTNSFDQIRTLPIEKKDLEDFDHIFDFENTVEKDPLADVIHIVELFAGHIGLEIDNKSTSYRLPQEEISRALNLYPKSQRRRIGLQLHSTTPVRSYPKNRIEELVQKGLELDIEWVLMGSPGSDFTHLQHPQIINLTSHKPSSSMRESLALLATCDGFIGPDSSLTHFAGALDIQTVALYASFDAELRTSYQNSIHVIQAQAPCAPCFHHSKPHLGVMPVHCPGRGTLKCLVLESIKPETILRLLLSQISHAPYYS